MTASTVKKIYFATICWPPPLLLIVYPLVFVWGWNVVPQLFINYYPLYFAVGLVFLLADLWRSERAVEVKLVWTALNVFLGVVCLPIYWFRHVMKSEPVVPA